MGRTYYFISDLHIGGDEALGVCDFEDELIGLLERLAAIRDEDVELVIGGDAFGLWELNEVDGPDKLDALIGQFPRIFDALRAAGEKIRITLLAGNHDHELACYPEFVGVLAGYNVHLEQAESITRELDEGRIWIEHGNQHDPANRMPDYGNPHAQPVGYYITTKVVVSAGRRSGRGHGNWLRDLQSVYPTDHLPQWVLSNYFYREMSPLLRWVAMPFLLLFGVTLIVLVGTAMEALGITDTNIFLHNTLLQWLGIFGSIFQLVMTINVVILLGLLVVAIPVAVVLRDVRKTARRFGFELNPVGVIAQKEDHYLDAARRVFEADPAVAVFIYGHTHVPSVRRIGDRAVVNTGTWLKTLTSVKPRFGKLPSIYVPSFHLNVFRIHGAGGAVIVDHQRIEKTPARELTLLQRLLASHHSKTVVEPIPKRTVVSLRP